MNVRVETEREGPYRAPWLVFWVAFVVRVLYLTLAHTYRIRPYDDHLLFGQEMGRIARALATGFGFSDPFRGHTGPTTWVGPLYPLLLAGVFKLFGVFTPQSAWVILTINSLFSALTARTTWEIAARCFHRNVAKWSAWIWALHPAAMQYAVRWVWETSLTAFLFSWLLVVALRMRGCGEERTFPPAAPQSMPLALGPLGASLGFGRTQQSGAADLLACLRALGVGRSAGLAAPNGWGAAGGRDVYRLPRAMDLEELEAFHHFVPTRGNFGAELYLGNGPGSTGLLMEYDHPMQAPDQLRLYARMGEIGYSRMRGNEALALIRANPGHFAKNTLKRVFFFWAGVPHPVNVAPWVEYARSLNFIFGSVCGLLGLALALWRKAPAAWLLAWPFLLLPLVYYGVTVHARFRHPLEPLMVILGVYLFQSAELRPLRAIARRGDSLESVSVDQSGPEK